MHATNNKILSLVHHGNAGNVRQAAAAFLESNLLNQVITTLAYNPEAKVWNYLDLLPSKFSQLIREDLSKRTWAIPQENISIYPWYEILRLFLLKVQANKFLDIFGVQNELIGNLGFLLLDRHVSEFYLQEINAIYSYEDLAAKTFEAAKKKNILCLYDLPIPFYKTVRQIMQEEVNLFPCFQNAIQSVNEPNWKLERKQREVELADHIFVASSITKTSLTNVGIDPSLINVIPYGSPVDIFKPQSKSDDYFRIVFVGKISPLKGVHYLLAAWKEIDSQKLFKNSQLVLIGQNLFPKGWLEENYGALYTHVPSVSHFSLNKYYSQSNILVLPSLIDGFGLVVLEAMACGIPVILTANTGASDIIADGIEGFIIPIRDVKAIAEKLEWCYSHPQELAEMGRAARRKAEELSWGLYRQRLSSKVRSLLQA